MTLKEAQERIAQLEADKAARRPKPSLKVSGKGGVSLYGLGRFPITLYREQWETVLGMKDAIASFIAANAGALKTKEA